MIVLLWLSIQTGVQIVCMWSADAITTLKNPSLASFKSRLVLRLWYRIAQVVPEKRPLNGCSSSSMAAIFNDYIIDQYQNI